MKKPYSLLPWLIGLVFFLMACGLGGGAASTKEVSTPLPAAVPNTPARPAIPAPTAEQPASPVRGTGDFDLPDPAVGLDGLNSYRQTLQTSFEGAINGEQQQSEAVLTREVAGEPAAELTWIETGGQGAQFFGSLGGILYSKASPDAPCSAFPDQSDASAPTSAYPFAALPPIAGATFVDEGEISSIPTKHYTFDEQAIGFSSPAKAQGEVWVASSGGYVVRYTLSLEALDDQLGPGVTGVQSWSYDLSEVNTGTIRLPEDCQPPLEYDGEVPLLDGAVVVLDQPGYLVYQAPGSVEAAVAFYQEQAEGLGWLAGTPVEFGTGTPESVTRLTLRPGDGSLIQLAFEMVSDSLTVTVQSLEPLPTE